MKKLITIIFCWLAFITTSLYKPVGAETSQDSLNDLTSLTIASPAKASPSQGFCGLDVIECETTQTISTQNQFKIINAIVYAYNAEESQTDKDFCITASGYNLCDNMSSFSVANNCLAFNSLVNIAGNLYTVRDRMNVRYTKCGEKDTWYFDVFFKDRKSALNWGKRLLTVKVYE